VNNNFEEKTKKKHGIKMEDMCKLYHQADYCEIAVQGKLIHPL
jgi:hypothetical protein